MLFLFPLILAVSSAGPLPASEESWMCEASTVVRIDLDDEGLFRVREQKTQLRILIDQIGITVYEYEGEIVFNPDTRMPMECTWHQNRPVLCLGAQGKYGRTLGRDSFELRADNTFLLHQIGIGSSESNDGWESVDKITVGRCSIGSPTSSPE